MTRAKARILENRLAQVMGWSLQHGSHPENVDGKLCVMEAVAYVAGRPWSDSPPCVSNAVGAFMRSWNDGLPSDEDRDRLLKPLITTLIGTKTTKADEQRRAFMAMDWLVRVWTPKWLELVPALKPHALALRECEEICDAAGLVAAATKLSAAREASAAAWAAARAAAGAAVWAAAGAAAGAAVWAAAGAAAGAAARAAAWDAAREAAWAAAWEAAWDALKPTTEWLQASAQDLVQRMCAVGREPQEKAA
jgi:hypothetical protein